MPNRRARIFWFAGLSGSGKSTVARETSRRLEAAGFKTLILDGDAVRGAEHRHLGFTAPDIRENLRLLAERCASARETRDAILVAAISPLADARAGVRARLGPGFHLVYLRASIAALESRDPKGLYARARKGELPDLIGYGPAAVPFEEPADADLLLDTTATAEADTIAAMMAFARQTLGD